MPSQTELEWNATGHVATFIASLEEQLTNELSSSNNVEKTLLNAIEKGDLWYSRPAVPVLGSEIKPDDFYLPNVFIWMPHIMCPTLKIRCPTCDSTSTEATRVHSRRVIGFKASYFVLSSFFQCLSCTNESGEEFSLVDSEVLSRLSPDLAALFPGRMSAQGGIDEGVATLLETISDTNTADDMRNLLLVLHQKKYNSRRRSYDFLASERLKCDDVIAFPAAFSDFDDPKGYCGFLPSAEWIALCLSKKPLSRSMCRQTVTATQSPTPNPETLTPENSPKTCSSESLNASTPKNMCNNSMILPSGVRIACTNTSPSEGGMCGNCTFANESVAWTSTIPPLSVPVHSIPVMMPQPPQQPSHMPMQSWVKPPSLCHQSQCVGAAQCPMCLMVFQEQQKQQQQQQLLHNPSTKRQRSDWQSDQPFGHKTGSFMSHSVLMPPPAFSQHQLSHPQLTQQVTQHQPVPQQQPFETLLSAASAAKKQRRPRRCQNRGIMDGNIITCGQIDCPGRGGQKHCRTFMNSNEASKMVFT